MKNRKREICTSGSVRDEDGQPPHLLGRRNFLRLAAGAAALPGVARIAFAQTYPSRPVRIIVGFPPGGPGDIVTRLMGEWLSERLQAITAFMMSRHSNARGVRKDQSAGMPRDPATGDGLHPNSSSTSWQADYPIFRGQERTRYAHIEFFAS
jgi:hypothetical protein